MKSILVTTDGSNYAGEAIELACDLAEKHAASLKLLHVLLKDKGRRNKSAGALSFSKTWSSFRLAACFSARSQASSMASPA